MQSEGSGKLPAQTMVNPKNENVSAITLRSGKFVDANCRTQQTSDKEVEKEKQTKLSNSSNKNQAVDPPPHSYPLSTAVKEDLQPIPLPFPYREARNQRSNEIDKDKEILETFRRIEVNIPLLEAIKQIPRYAKFLKELCTHKRRLKGNEKISMGQNVSALIQQPMPQKCKDPGMFTIPCTIGNCRFENAMLDLGASINVMPMSIFNSLSVGPLHSTGIIIQLANRSHAYPTGLVEDVLVRVDNLIFPPDFYILDMEGEFSTGKAPIILGRPFLKTVRTKIDVHAGTLSMEFGDCIVRFNIFYSMNDSMVQDNSIFSIDVVYVVFVLKLKVGFEPEEGKRPKSCHSQGEGKPNAVERKDMLEIQWKRPCC
ncbi:hypothetical protein VNO77_02741 [Canavalia gladiata]|uniref:Aspartic peptidase DDI1-type domain-containing protein n=1 Tax=Canavalia gladiata TaxID=3824 RepID=A0AAN9MU69_CANGL